MENFKSIKNWQSDDRPREKFLEHGIASLTHSELIALIIGSGTRQLSAVDVGKLLLDSAQTPSDIKKYTVKDFCKIKGIGEAKAIKLISALEIGGRFENFKHHKKKITSSEDLHNHLSQKFKPLKYEEFWLICLNQKLEILKTKKVSEGGISSTIVDPKKIFRVALEFGSSAIMVAHNHPSGHSQPSKSDDELTSKLCDAAKLLDIRFLDHIIIGTDEYFSYNDEGLIF